MTITEARDLFPHLKTGQIYFNHAAIGPWCKFAVDRVNEYTTQRSGEKIENFPNFLKWNVSAKDKLSALINAKPDRLAWVENVSSGINILAQGLSWKTGDRILLNDIEFPSNVYPFINLKNLGVEIDFVKSKNGIVNIEDIEKSITPKTKLLSISLVQFLSGYKSDVKAIGEICKKHGIIFSVDAIQATGTMQIDVVDANIDFLTGGSHKWLMSCQGASYLFVTEELQAKLNQKNVGWISVKDPWNLLDYDLTLRDSADRFQTGGVNALGISILDAVLNLFINFGIKDIEKNILGNTDYFIEKLDSIGVDPLLRDSNMINRSGIVSFKHDRSNEIFEKLNERRIYCAVREGMIRLSPHFYNTHNEIDLVIDELKNII